jgi:predicted phosphodiesterase
MRAKTFAVLTDIHSNLESFETALSVIEDHESVDQIIFIGDYFSLGPAPNEILDTLLKLDGSILVRGNHERYIKERLWEQDNPTLEGMDPDDPVTKEIVANEKWTADQIGERGLDLIKTMDISYREIVGTTLIEFTHAWFERDEEPPTMEEAKEWRNKAMEENPDLDRFVFIHGHAHIPREEHDGNLTVFCQGSTGLPFDKDDRGAIAFLTINEGVDWDVTRFDYNREATIDLLEERQPPFYANLQNTLRFAEIRNDI